MNQPTHGKAVIRTSQFIASALMMSVIMFGGIAVASRLGKPPVAPGGGNNNSMMLVMLIMVAVGDLVAWFIYRSIFDRNMAKKLADHPSDDFGPSELLGAYQTRLIVSLAILNGVAFFALIAFIAEGRWESFGIAMFLLLLMAMSFPTENKFRGWIRKLTGRSEYAGDE